MEAFIFVPGLFGSELFTPRGGQDGNTRVWPPSAWQIVNESYDKIDLLVREDLVVRSILESVFVCNVYGDILRDLDNIADAIQADGGPARVVRFPYDWRRDIAVSADALANRLDTLVAEEPEARITLISHSMGGLVCRYMLESGAFEGRDWFPDRLGRLITIATPHAGAPLALDRALGLSGTMGMTATDVQTLSQNRAFPSGYQLIPGPGRPFLRDFTAGASGSFILDLHDDNDATAIRLGLDPINLGRTRALHAALDVDKRPRVPIPGSPGEHRPMDYVFYAGSGLSTVNALEIRGKPVSVKDKASGDEVVPAFSAAPGNVPTYFLKGEHVSVLGNYRLREALYRLLGAPDRAHPVSADGTEAGQAVVADVSVPFEGVVAGQDFEVLINFHQPQAAIRDELRLQPDEMLRESFEAMKANDYKIAYEGAPLDSLVLRLTAPAEPGIYEVGFTALSSDDPTKPRLTVRTAAP